MEVLEVAKITTSNACELFQLEDILWRKEC
jgi:hypothetical protein